MKGELDIERLRRLEQAADWLQQLRERTDDGVVERWLDWCAQDPQRQQVFDELSAVWFAAAQAPARGRLRPARRWMSALAASVLVGALLAGVAGWQLWHDRDAAALVLASPVGGNSHTELPDGSVVELGGRSEAAVHYGRWQRQVRLRRGQIFVTVVRDAGRPFVVETGELQVTAVGTAFDVLHEAGRSVVTVLEGQVEVRVISDGADREAAPAAVRLAAGQQLLHVAGARTLPVRQVDAGAATAWRGGVMVFVDEPLSTVVAAVSRYSNRQIVTGDPAVAALKFTGTARIDRIGSWVTALAEAFPVVAEEMPDGRLMLLTRPSPNGSPAGQ